MREAVAAKAGRYLLSERRLQISYADPYSRTTSHSWDASHSAQPQMMAGLGTAERSIRYGLTLGFIEGFKDERGRWRIPRSHIEKWAQRERARRPWLQKDDNE